MRQLLKRLEKEGWDVERRKSGHVKISHPEGGGQSVFASTSPSDHRSIKNTIGELRKIGYDG